LLCLNPDGVPLEAKNIARVKTHCSQTTNSKLSGRQVCLRPDVAPALLLQFHQPDALLAFNVGGLTRLASARIPNRPALFFERRS